MGGATRGLSSELPLSVFRLLRTLTRCTTEDEGAQVRCDEYSAT